jgi:hypothetical protein
MTWYQTKKGLYLYPLYKQSFTLFLAAMDDEYKVPAAIYTYDESQVDTFTKVEKNLSKKARHAMINLIFDMLSKEIEDWRS